MRVKIECVHQGPCRASKVWEGEVPERLIPVVALWFHSAHEGHMFRWYENGELILPALSESS